MSNLDRPMEMEVVPSVWGRRQPVTPHALKVLARAPPEVAASMADLLSPTLHERPLILLEDALGLPPHRLGLNSLSINR